MRVTERLKFLTANRKVDRIRNEQQRRMTQLASGRRNDRLSGDPIAAQKITQMKKTAAKVDQYQRNIDYARHPLEVADSTLGETNQLLFRLKETVIQGLQTSLTQEDRDHLANEVLVIRDQLRDLSNTQVNDQYLFGGFTTDTEPYDPTFAFVGDTNAREVQITDGLRVKSALAGGRVFGDGTAGTVDIFDNVNQMEVAIRAGIEVDMQTEFARLDDSIEQVISSQNEVGIQLTRIEGAQRISEFYQERYEVMISEQQDADFTETVSELQLVENALQVALATSGKMMQRGSLLDFI
jgi:flagellar hook-associated protein 3 FlgL